MSDTFKINHGVKQGCVSAPTLFTLYLAAVVETVGSNLSKGVYIRTRPNGKRFNLARLKASTKTREVCVRELLYADDSALVSTNAKDLHEIVTCFATTFTMFGCKINVSKTELLYQPPSEYPTHCPEILVSGSALSTKENFIYLGSAVTSNNSSDLEVQRRIQPLVLCASACGQDMMISRGQPKLRSTMQPSCPHFSTLLSV